MFRNLSVKSHRVDIEYSHTRHLHNSCFQVSTTTEQFESSNRVFCGSNSKDSAFNSPTTFSDNGVLQSKSQLVKNLVTRGRLLKSANQAVDSCNLVPDRLEHICVDTLRGSKLHLHGIPSYTQLANLSRIDTTTILLESNHLPNALVKEAVENTCVSSLTTGTPSLSSFTLRTTNFNGVSILQGGLLHSPRQTLLRRALRSKNNTGSKEVTLDVRVFHGFIEHGRPNVLTVLVERTSSNRFVGVLVLPKVNPCASKVRCKLLFSQTCSRKTLLLADRLNNLQAFDKLTPELICLGSRTTALTLTSLNETSSKVREGLEDSRGSVHTRNWCRRIWDINLTCRRHKTRLTLEFRIKDSHVISSQIPKRLVLAFRKNVQCE